MTAKELIENASDKALILEPQSTFNHALIGVTTDGRLVYSEDKILVALQDIEGMTYEEALDYYGYNTVRSLAYGKATVTPVIIAHSR